MTYTQLALTVLGAAVLLDLAVFRVRLLRRGAFWTAYGIVFFVWWRQGLVMVPEGSQAQDLFRLKSALFSTAVSSTRVFSTAYLTSLTGEKSESIGMTPMACSSFLLSSPGQ